jgi:hypothetical protein
VHLDVVVGELAQPLPAAAARGDQRRVRVDGDLGDPLRTARDERADRAGLGALALRVGGVLDVGARVDRAVIGAQRGADGERRSRPRGQGASVAIDLAIRWST